MEYQSTTDQSVPEGSGGSASLGVGAFATVDDATMGMEKEENLAPGEVYTETDELTGYTVSEDHDGGVEDVPAGPDGFRAAADRSARSYMDNFAGHGDYFLGETSAKHSLYEGPSAAKSGLLYDGDFSAKMGDARTTLKSTPISWETPTSTPLIEPSSKPKLKSKALDTSPKPKVKQIIGEFKREFSMYIDAKHGIGFATADKITETVHAKAKEIPQSYAIQLKKSYKLKGNLTVEFDSNEYDIIVQSIKRNGTEQLVVVLRRLSGNGRASFGLLVRHIAWDLKKRGYATTMADGTMIYEPAAISPPVSDEEEKMESDDDDDDLDDLAPPPMIGLLGLSRVVKPKRRCRSAVKLTKGSKETAEVFRFWQRMLTDRCCPDTLKTIARCSEVEKNARVLAANQSLLNAILQILAYKGRQGERDQQVVHCSLSIIRNVVRYEVASVGALVRENEKILVDLVDQLEYFAGVSQNKRHLRSCTIQDASIQTLKSLTNYLGESAFADGSKDQLRSILKQKQKIFNQDSVNALEAICRTLSIA